ncbi:MAG TPA: substrate-binding domain-containing protein [Polyangiaceae bacterium]
MAKRRAIGLLTTGFADGLERAVFAGVAEAAKAADVDLTVVAGGRLDSPFGYEARANVLYEFVSRERMDGFLIRAGTMGIFAGLELVREFCLHYGMPVVTIGASLPGLPRVLVDSYKAMYAEVTHLIEVHGLRRIAFVGGPAEHQEAEDRFRAYVDALRAHEIEVDPRLLCKGAFLRESGIAAVERLVDGTDRVAQALVAANDEMALGAIHALNERGIDVPGGMAVVGFDDIDPSGSVGPPLTTVRMDLADVGRRAAELLVQRLRGEEIPETSVVSLPLVIRRSCGCLPFGAVSREGATLSSRPSRSASRGDRLTHELTTWLAERRGLEGETPTYDWAQKLVTAFRADLNDAASTRFAATWDELLRRFPAISIAHLSDMAAIFHREALPFAEDDPERWRRALELSEQAIILVGEATRQRKAWEGWQSREQADRLRALGERLIGVFDLDKVVDGLAEELPHFGIRRCYLALYEDTAGVREWSRLLLAYDENGRIPLEKGGRLLRSTELVPPEHVSQERSTFAVYALYFEDQQQGIIVFDVTSSEQGVVCSAVRGQVSTVVRGTLLLRQLEARAEELERAYRFQQEQHTRLLISEKMASLGRLTAGIAHELGTPLAAVRSSLSELEELIKEYTDSIEHFEADDHRQIAGEMQQALVLARRAAERTASFVAGIKSQTRDLAPQQARSFDAVAAIRDALLLLSYSLREGNCDAVFEPSAESIRIRGSPGRFGQVVTNLVGNSVEALLPRGGGRIEVILREDTSTACLEVRDAGVGIAADVLPKIFDPMFSTKPFGEATGLGLTVVHDIVKGEFGGSIDVDSEEGVGTTVRIRVPKASA